MLKIKKYLLFKDKRNYLCKKLIGYSIVNIETTKVELRKHIKKRMIFMGNIFANILYLIVTFVIIMAVISFVAWILPYVLLVLIFFWIYRYIKNNFINKSNKNNKSDFTGNSSESMQNYGDDSSSDVIDVDYEDVKK